jgi:hypothetical protein
MAKVLADEARTLEPTVGVSTFTKTFPERGPRNTCQLQATTPDFWHIFPRTPSDLIATCAGK